VPVRSDFVGPLRAAQQTLHDRGCTLPLVSGPLGLPPASSLISGPLEPLDYIGRTLRIASGVALSAPATDPIVLARTAGSSDPYQIAARSLTAGTVAVPAANYDALQVSDTGVTTVALTAASLVMLSPILAAAGFSPASPLPQPTATERTNWTRLANTGGLVSGTTKLGEELRLLHSPTEIAGSAFSGMLNWTWSGSAFAP
jgi:hypothetical protein